jgi:hypothetical protein
MHLLSRSFFLILVGLVLWFALAWVNLYLFSLPWADPWCYLGPAVVNPSPFHLQVPFWGGFLGSNHVWGLHFPGAPLIYSCIFSLVKFRPYIGVLLFIALWVALAICAGWMALQLTGQAFWAVAAGAAILSDRSLFIVAQAQRPELAGSIDLLVVWMALAGMPPARGRLRSVCLFLSFFLLPLLHPVTLVAGGCLCVALWWPGERRGGADWRTSLLASLGYAGGGVTLFLWFYLQPDAWSQFSDHAASVNIPYSFGVTLWRSLQQYYYPTFSGHLLLAAAILLSASILFSRIRNPRGPVPAGFWGAATLALCLLAEQKFNNTCYLALIIPEAVLITLLFLFKLEQGAAIQRPNPWIRALLVASLCVHGLFWATRTSKFLQAGSPDIRKELDEIAGHLPKQGHVLIPEALWEAALRDPSRFDLNTLPQFASPHRREDYESATYGKLTRGDLVIVDRFQLNQPLEAFPGAEWTVVGEHKHTFPGRAGEWGYDLTIRMRN